MWREWKNCVSDQSGATPPGRRLTPYELIFQPLEQSAFAAIRVEAAQRGSDPADREQFALLGLVGATLQEMAADDAPPQAIESYTELLHQGYQFWSFGRRVYVLSERAMARITRPAYDLHNWILAAPPACYLQFPAQRIWARVGPEQPYEPADGCFVAVRDGAAGDATAELRILLVLGLREERPGISLVSRVARFDPHAAADRGRAPWRDGSAAFSNAIPGGERMGYLTIATMSELEALVLRALQYVDRHPERLEAEPAHEGVRRIIVDGMEDSEMGTASHA